MLASIASRNFLSCKMLRLLILSAAALFIGVNLLAADDDAPKIPEPEDVTLETKDGVALHCTYFGGFLKKKAVPFMMIHGWGENRGEFDRLAKEMQKRGHAVLTIDLRGHGASIYFKANDEKKIDPTRMTAEGIKSMTLDLEAGKKLLMEKNNNGELNIDALSIVAAKEGAIPALLWATLDWSAPQLPAYRQGQDVKAIFLLSPVISFKGATAQTILTHRAITKEISIFVSVGKKDTKSFADAKRLHTTLSQQRRNTSGGVAELEEQFKAEKPKKEGLDFFYETEDTNLAGAALINTQGLKTFAWMLKFVKMRLVDRAEDFPWTDRKRP